VHMGLYMFICKYAYICIYACIYTYVCVHMYICIYVCVCTDMYMNMCILHIYVYMHTSIHICKFVCTCVCLYVCLYSALTCARFWCGMDAEEFALISALNHGEAWVSQMAVTAAPCGYCRQLLAEAFCTLHPDGEEEEGGAGEREFELFIRPSHTAFSLQQLLPMAFGPRDLEETSGLFTRCYHPLVLADDAPPEEAQDKEDEGIWRQLTIKALECATRSHSPYSNSPAGVALRLQVLDSGSDDRHVEGGGGEGRTGPGPGQWKIVGGSYYENCAFNPSTSPVKAALVAAVCSRLALDAISHAVLVQLEGAAISHAASTSALIASTSPTCAVRVVYARAPV
jgi:cytidine deaminase